jgi:hypothetical protein
MQQKEKGKAYPTMEIEKSTKYSRSGGFLFFTVKC